MGELRDCYDKIQHILGDDAEPFESVELVEKYRQYWKPDPVRVVLLAESHLFTSNDDRNITFPEIPELDTPANYPKNYARFVYCCKSSA